MEITIRNINLTVSAMLILSVVVFFITGCSNRFETPVINSDSTIVYPSKTDNGISARITLFRKINKTNGRLIGKGTAFEIKENRNLRALIDIENRNYHNDQELMFHIDWIGDDGKSFYRKQITLLPNDSSTTLASSISISPESRTPGKYTLRIYLFRELIAEKIFELIASQPIAPLKGEEMKADITLYRKKSKQTGELIGEGTVFHIKNKRSVRAIINLQNRSGYGERELKFKIKWIDENGSTTYHKQEIQKSSNPDSILYSSISISPGKRPPGKYTIQVYLFNKLIGEKEFEIK